MLRTYTVFNVAQIDGLPTDPIPISNRNRDKTPP